MVNFLGTHNIYENMGRQEICVDSECIGVDYCQIVCFVDDVSIQFFVPRSSGKNSYCTARHLYWVMKYMNLYNMEWYTYCGSKWYKFHRDIWDIHAWNMLMFFVTQITSLISLTLPVGRRCPSAEWRMQRVSFGVSWRMCQIIGSWLNESLKSQIFQVFPWSSKGTMYIYIYNYIYTHIIIYIYNDICL